MIESLPAALLIAALRTVDVSLGTLGVAKPFLDRCFLTIGDEQPLPAAFPRGDALKK
jgi:hypothetical protein